MTDHAHVWITTYVDANENRTRVIERCAVCGDWRMLTCAWRVDELGRLAWGPPGEWWSSGPWAP